MTKRYGDHTAVSDLSFSIEKGRIYGFLGPNGAGKSTTMNIMTGCLAASSGEVKIGGYDIFEDAEQAKRLIGYLPEQPPLYLDRTPREYLTFVARAKGVSRGELAGQLEHVMAVTQITDVADRLIKHLSKGYKQRVGIAQALLGVLIFAAVAAIAATNWKVEPATDTEPAAEQTIVFALEKDAVSRMSWTYGGETLTFDLAEEIWTYAADPAFPTVPLQLNLMVSALQSVEASKTLENVEDLQPYGLDDPICTVTVTVDGAEQTVFFGAETSLGGERYLSLGDGNVYLVDSAIETLLTTQPADLMSE